MAQVRRWFGGWRSEEGAQLVEFALVLPLLLLVVLGIAEFGFMFQRYEVVTNAAREGARMAVLPGYTTATCERACVALRRRGSRAQTTSTVIRVSSSTDDIDPGDGEACPPMQRKRVTVTYTLHAYSFFERSWRCSVRPTPRFR